MESKQTGSIFEKTSPNVLDNPLKDNESSSPLRDVAHSKRASKTDFYPQQIVETEDKDLSDKTPEVAESTQQSKAMLGLENVTPGRSYSV